MKKFLKKEKKGFTLIEIVVVLAILAVLIAFLVPNLIGYLGQANTTSDEATAKLVYTSYVATLGSSEDFEDDEERAAEVARLAGLSTAQVVIGADAEAADTAYIVVSGTDGDDITVHYNDSTYPKTTD